MIETNHSGRWYTPIFLATIFFVIGYFSTFMEAMLPVLKQHFHLNYTVMSLFDSSFFIAYACFSYSLARILRSYSLIHCLQSGFGIIIFGSGLWCILLMVNVTGIWLLLLATFIIASGVVLLFIIAEFMGLYLNNRRQTNRLSLFQAAHGIGGVIAPSFLIALLYHHQVMSGYISSNIHSSMWFFLFSSIILVIVIMLLPFSGLPKGITISASPASNHYLNSEKLTCFILWLALFVYVGVEVTIGSFIISHGVVQYHVASHLVARFLVMYWVFIIVGRFIGGFIIDRFSDHLLLIICTGSAIILVIFAMYVDSIWGLYLLTLTGLGNSIIFPMLYSLGLSSYKNPGIEVSAIMATAICGGAIMPLLTGMVADQWNLAMSLWVCVFCYVCIACISFLVGNQ